MSIHSINHVQLTFDVDRRDQVRHFYGTLVGLTELHQPTGPGLRFIAGSQRVDLVPASQAQPGGGHVAFEVQNLPRLRHQLLQADLALEEHQPLPGYLRFYVNDPAGNRLEFLEPDPHQASLV